MGSALASHLRSRISVICDHHERAVEVLEELAALDRPATVDHLPEVLDSIATLIECAAEGKERTEAFTLLAEGHALQRLGFGVTLETLTREYTILRECILLEMLDAPVDPGTRRDLITLNLALDHAVMESVRRYTMQRDLVRERFIGMLGHDLRGPLSAITAGAGALLAADGLDARHTRIAARLSSSAHRMGRMIGDLLDFARGHLGAGIPARPIRCDLGQLCRHVVDEVHAAHADRIVRLELHGDLAGSWDADRLSQAIGNLIDNAVAHGRDPVVVQAREAADRRSVSIEVCNEGPAIPAELLPRLFDPFRGGRGGRSAGLGLGLYIVKQVARAHGGSCEVSSTDERTLFTMQLPRVPLEETPSRP